MIPFGVGVSIGALCVVCWLLVAIVKKGKSD